MSRAPDAPAPRSQDATQRKTFSLAKHIQHEAERHGAYYAQPDGRVSYGLPTQTLECITEEHIVSMRTARAVASAIGIVIT